MADTPGPVPDWSNPYTPPAVDLEHAPAQGVELEPVGFWRRAAARILDMVAAQYVLAAAAGAAVNFTGGFLASVRGPEFAAYQETLKISSWVELLVTILGAVLFQIILEGWHGCSFGKYLLKIVVLQGNGRPCTPLQALKREILYFVDVLLFGAVAAYNMSESSLKQRLGDSWARTVVVHRRSAPPQSLRSGSRFAIVLLLASITNVAVQVTPYLYLISRF